MLRRTSLAVPRVAPSRPNRTTSVARAAYSGTSRPQQKSKVLSSSREAGSFGPPGFVA